MPRVHTALADASWSFGSEEKGVGVAAMRDVTARTIPWIPPTDRTGRGRPVDGIMPAGGLTETTRQTTSAEDPSSDAISFCLPIKWRLPVGTRYGYPKPTHQSGASGGCSCDSRPAEGWTAEAAIAFGEFVQPSTTTLKVVGATLVGSMAPLDAVSPEGGAVAAATERAHVRARAHRQRFFDAVRRAHRRRRSRWQSFFLTAAPRLRPFEPTDTPPTISARTSSSALPGRATRRGRWRIRQVRRAPSALRTHR